MARYRVGSKLEYKPERSVGKLKSSATSKSRSSWRTWSSFGRPKVTRLALNIMDIASFLGRYLSGRKEVAVSAHRTGAFSTSLEQQQIRGRPRPLYRIRIPKWDDYKVNLDEFSKYRLFRHGVYHEAMHVRYTPPLLIVGFGKNEPTIYREVMNVIEDRRIEDLGQEEWPGYLPERLFVQAYAYAVRPDVGAIYNLNLPEDHPENQRAVFEAFLQRMLIGRIKGEDRLPAQLRSKIEKLAEKIERALKRLKKSKEDLNRVYDEVAELTRMTVKELNLEPKYHIQLNNSGSQSSWDDTFTSDSTKPKKELQQDMEEFFQEKEKEAVKERRGREIKKKNPNIVTDEDVQQARHGSADVQTEFTKVKSGKTMPKELEFGWASAVSRSSASPFRDQGFISKMKTLLKDWRIGYRDLYAKAGSKLSIPAYIRTRGKEAFKRRIKTSAKGQKVLVIADLSGSIKDSEHKYKTALISSLEVIDSIGVKTALFTFATDPSLGDGFYAVKTFEEPRWTANHSSKLAALLAEYPCTPTADVYRLLNDYIQKHKPQITVTVTDGAPDNAVATANEVRKLKRHTRMVAFGIATGVIKHKDMRQMLKKFGYNRSVAVRDIHELPPKLVKLIAPY